MSNTLNELKEMLFLIALIIVGPGLMLFSGMELVWGFEPEWLAGVGVGFGLAITIILGLWFYTEVK